VLDDTVREMVQLRSHHCAEGGFGLTRLYNSLDDGGYRDLAAATCGWTGPSPLATAGRGWSRRTEESSLPASPPEC